MVVIIAHVFVLTEKTAVANVPANCTTVDTSVMVAAPSTVTLCMVSLLAYSTAPAAANR